MFGFFSLQGSNYQISSSSGTFALATTTETDVTNLSVSINVSGNRAVWLGLISDGSGNESFYRLYNLQGPSARIRFYRDATNFDSKVISASGASVGNTSEVYFPPSAICTEDRPAAGTYTYKVTLQNVSTSASQLYYAKLFAIELRY